MDTRSIWLVSIVSGFSGKVHLAGCRNRLIQNRERRGPVALRSLAVRVGAAEVGRLKKRR